MSISASHQGVLGARAKDEDTVQPPADDVLGAVAWAGRGPEVTAVIASGPPSGPFASEVDPASMLSPPPVPASGIEEGAPQMGALALTSGAITFHGSRQVTSRGDAGGQVARHVSRRFHRGAMPSVGSVVYPRL